MDAEVIDNYFLAMMLGAEPTSDGTIAVTSAIPTTLYTAEGTFRKTSATGASTYQKIQFFSLKPQVTADITLSAADVSSFSLVMDILADEVGKIMTLTDSATGVTTSVNQAPVVEE